MEEEWRDIEGYENLYQISNLGRVKSLNRKSKISSVNRDKCFEVKIKEKILKQELTRVDAYRVSLSKNGEVKRFLVHRLVALAFIPNPDKKPQVNHIDGNRKNNNSSNLEWVTRSENMIHAYKTGLQVPLKGELHQNTKLTDSDVEYIRNNYIAGDNVFGARPMAKKFNISTDHLKAIANGRGRV